MHPFFLDPTGRQLFVVHHPPAGPISRTCCVVVCYPWGYEYVNALRGCRQLAGRLAREGFHVLRFDYSGSGDSGGLAEESELGAWKQDLALAIEELRQTSGVSTVALVGVRLGATLAALVAAERADIGALVLWEPIVHGDDHLRDMRERHASFLRSEEEGGRDAQAYSSPEEIMGFPLPARLARQVEAIDLTTIARCPPHVLLIETEDEKLQGRLGGRLRDLGAEVEHKRLLGQQVWVREPGQERALVPRQVLDAVLAWFTSRWP
jgi:pimeloyl-ACP methyl ester carboxylesterase